MLYYSGGNLKGKELIIFYLTVAESNNKIKKNNFKKLKIKKKLNLGGSSTPNSVLNIVN